MKRPPRKLTRAHLLAIGRFITACASLEAEMYDAIAKLYSLDPEDGLLLSGGIAAKTRSRVLCGFAHRYTPYQGQELFLELMRRIERQLDNRDFVVRAHWETARWSTLRALARHPGGYRSEWCPPETLAEWTADVWDSQREFGEAASEMVRQQAVWQEREKAARRAGRP